MSKITEDLRALGFPDLADAWDDSQKDQPQMRVFRNRTTPIKSFKESPTLRVIIGGLFSKPTIEKKPIVDENEVGCTS